MRVSTSWNKALVTWWKNIIALLWWYLHTIIKLWGFQVTTRKIFLPYSNYPQGDNRTRICSDVAQAGQRWENKIFAKRTCKTRRGILQGSGGGYFIVYAFQNTILLVWKMNVSTEQEERGGCSSIASPSPPLPSQTHCIGRSKGFIDFHRISLTTSALPPFTSLPHRKTHRALRVKDIWDSSSGIVT